MKETFQPQKPDTARFGVVWTANWKAFVKWMDQHPEIDRIEYADTPPYRSGQDTYVGPVVIVTRKALD